MLQLEIVQGIYSFVTQLQPSTEDVPDLAYESDEDEEDEDPTSGVTGFTNFVNGVSLPGVIELESELPSPILIAPIKRQKRASTVLRQGVVTALMMVKVFLTLGNMSVEELMHLRMNHPSLPRLVKLNGRVDGLPRQLSQVKQYNHPCHHCQDANAIRNDFPPASGDWADGPDLWSWDLVDMGDVKTLDGNRYLSMFVIKKSRFGMIILHKDRSAVTTKIVLDKAFGYAGCQPKIIRSDGAGE